MKFNPKIHKRRSIRLKGYDYSKAGLYFVTICCQNNAYLFGSIGNEEMKLNDAGQMIERWYFELENKFPNIKCDTMVVMPNHFHCIIEIVETTSDLNKSEEKDHHLNEFEKDHDLNEFEKKNHDLNEFEKKDHDLSKSSHPIVRADLRVCPTSIQDNAHKTSILGEHKTPILGEHKTPILGEHKTPILGEHKTSILGEHKTSILGEHKTSILGEHKGSPLSVVLQWFKTMTTNEYIRGVKHLNWPPFDKKVWQRNYYEHIIRDHRAYENISNYIINNPKKWKDDKFHQIIIKKE